jgi:hypothetical protein
MSNGAALVGGVDDVNAFRAEHLLSKLPLAKIP